MQSMLAGQGMRHSSKQAAANAQAFQFQVPQKLCKILLDIEMTLLSTVHEHLRLSVAKGICSAECCNSMLGLYLKLLNYSLLVYR